VRLAYILLSSVLVSSLLACGPESTPRSEACSCVPDDEGSGMTPPSPIDCGDDLCPTILVDDIADNAGTEVKNPEALTCAFDALKSGKPGVIRWSFKANYSQYDEEGYIVIRDGGTLIRRNWGQMDLDYIVGNAIHGEPPSANQLEACTVMTDAVDRFECLRSFAITEIDICDDGWSIVGS